jgi:hypothetical protein
MAKTRRHGIAKNTMAVALGNWNEKSLLPVGWLFSIWLQLRYPSRSGLSIRRLQFEPQNIAITDVKELADQKSTNGFISKKVIVSDFAVIAREIQNSEHRFVSAEIKYSKQRVKDRLTSAITSQLMQQKGKEPPPGLKADHTLIFVTSPSIKNKSNLAELEETIGSELGKLGYKIPKDFTEARVVSIEGAGMAGAIYRLHRKESDKDGNSSTNHCWIWIAHYKLASQMFAKLVVGDSGSYHTADDVERYLLRPIYTSIDSKLQDIFKSEKSSPLSDGLKDLVIEPLRPLSNLVQFFTEPLVFLTNYFLEACRASVTQLAEDKGGFTWNRLLYRFAEKEIADHKSNAIRNWNRNTIPPMPLRIVERNRDGVYQADSVQVLLETLRSPRIAVLEGHSGSGKSTLLEFINLTWLDSLQHAGSLSGQTELPLLLRLQMLKPDQIESLDKPEVLPEIFRLPAASMAILMTSPVCLVIDAFDQIADNDESIAQFQKLPMLLENAGFVISRIIISSRPLFRADLAMKKWHSLFKTIEKGNAEPLIRVFQMMPPNDRARNAFVKKWLGFLSEIKDTDGQKQKLTVENFYKWLKTIVRGDGNRETGNLTFNEDTILASPLLLSLALYVYVQKSELSVLDIRSTSDLFDAVVHAGGDNRKQIETKRTGGWSVSLKKVSEVSWGHIANPVNTLGHMFGSDRLWFSESVRIPSATPKRQKQVKTELPVGKFPSINDFPFLTVHENGESIEFVHPSFQEYLAARWLADTFFGSKKPLMLTVGGRKPEPELGSAGIYEGRLGAFAESCLRLGREGFRFLLGRVYRNMRSDNNDSGRRRVEAFLNLIQAELCFQQYLYDAGFLDEAIAELLLLSETINAKYTTSADHTAKLLLNKLIAHTYYGKADPALIRTSLNELLKIVEAESEFSWMKLFAMDHIFNRFGNVKDLDGNVKTRINSYPDYFKRAEERYKLAGRSWRSIQIEPRAFQVTLRFGHYYGHRGNQTMGSSTERDWNSGIDHFSRAILYRAVDARLTLTATSFKKLSALATDLTENKWYKLWISKPTRLTKAKFEGFVGPSQAFGDTAQQYCARAQLHLNKFLYGNRFRSNDLKKAKLDQERARSLWRLALEPDGIDCSGGLKYFVWTVALDVRMQMIEDWMSGQLGKLVAYQNRTKRDLEEAESKIGFHYQQSRHIEGKVAGWYSQLKSLI